jgi:hypothetical protein
LDHEAERLLESLTSGDAAPWRISLLWNLKQPVLTGGIDYLKAQRFEGSDRMMAEPDATNRQKEPDPVSMVLESLG